MNAKLNLLVQLKFCVLKPTSPANQYTYPLNPTQNHLVNSTLPIFNLSTQPLFSSGQQSLKAKKSESRKNTSNSRKFLIFKPFSVFSSVLLTAILRTQHEMSVETGHTPYIFLIDIPVHPGV